MADGGPVVRLEKKAGRETGGRVVVVASAPLEGRGDGPLYLRIDARGGEYDFYYGRRPGEWIPLRRGADGKILSTKTAGGFVGTMLGMYAYTDGTTP